MTDSNTGAYRKKPVVIEAVQLTREVIKAHLFDKAPLPDGVLLWNATYHAGNRTISYAKFGVNTLEGKMEASEGDWIIKGVKGEFYPCKPDIFAATYEPADSAPSVAAAAGEMMRALEKAERLHQIGILAMHDDEINDVHASRRAAITAAHRAGIRTQGK